MPLKFVKSQKGKNLLVHEGYTYTCKTVNKKSITWRCNEHSRKFACSVIIHTSSQDKNGNIIGDVPIHNHPADLADVKSKAIRSTLKRRAVSDDVGPIGVIADVVKNVKSPVAARLGTISSMQRTIQRARQKTKPTAPEKNLGDFIVPDESQRTSKDEQFLLFDSGGHRNRILIFSTASNLIKLAECEIWCGDGTFRTVPAIFKQLYSIHGVVGDNTMPLVYVLSSSKSKSIYLMILRKLKELLPDMIRLRRMLTDYELAYMNAFKIVFPGVNISGCLFHYTQCVWRHVQH
ncbi:uncharacterized protein LOC130666566 [Microplitis mediator]|uniref:uncharacterized protein LOC130666566 n=1 Tax=Microplitis mediator TaxID=375433 RepID=UPI0025552269|nr:uncharacterized protein LOC130666566 [Microplitis mediator]